MAASLLGFKAPSQTMRNGLQLWSLVESSSSITVLAITSLRGTTRARRFRPYDDQNGRLRSVVEKSLEKVLAIRRGV
jgi:hypothetical protein